MAPLKRVDDILENPWLAFGLPCLKGHGPIEAPMQTQETGIAGGVLPCLKGHGPIEAPSGGASGTGRSTRLPCLKGHGPIEAGGVTEGVDTSAVTMSERTWPH